MNPSLENPRAAIARALLCGIALTFSIDGATATVAAPTVDSVAREALLAALEPALAARGATATITLAPSDARRALAPCGLMAGFIPPGARLTGKTMVGVRCVDGAAWQTYVAADVRVDAAVWQATRALRAGEPLANGDVTRVTAAMTTADIDAAAAVARGPGGSASRGLASLDGRAPPPVGRTVQRPVGTGHALVAADVREEGRVGVGETVRVVYVGDGFSVASEGRTVGAADPGSSVQIRLASGSVVNGTLRADHQVELSR